MQAPMKIKFLALIMAIYVPAASIVIIVNVVVGEYWLALFLVGLLAQTITLSWIAHDSSKWIRDARTDEPTPTA
jgi:hypothetical protein